MFKDNHPLKSHKFCALYTHRHSLLLALNFLLLGIACFVATWFNIRIHSHRVFMEAVKPWHIELAVDWALGFVMVSVFLAVRKGPVQFARNPRRYLSKDSFDLLSSIYTSGVLFVTTIFFYVLILCNPAVHVDYSGLGDKPVVKIGGVPQEFVGNSITKFLDGKLLGAVDVEISDKYSVYSLRIDLQKDSSPIPIFWQHRIVDLDKFVSNTAFTFSLKDSPSQAEATYFFDFSSESMISLDDQCSQSDFNLFFESTDCGDFVRSLYGDVAKRSENHINRDAVGTFSYLGRTYRYSYNYKISAPSKIEISAIPGYLQRVQSQIATRGSNAFELYSSETNERRDQLLTEFSNDINSLGDQYQIEMFEYLWRSEALYEALCERTALKKVALRYVKDILSRGSEYVTQDHVSRLVDRITSCNLTRPDEDTGETIVLAIDAVLSLAPTGDVLKTLHSYVRLMGDLHTQTMAQIVRSIQGPFVDGADKNEEEIISAIISTIRETVRDNPRVLQNIAVAAREHVARQTYALQRRAIQRSRSFSPDISTER